MSTVAIRVVFPVVLSLIMPSTPSIGLQSLRTILLPAAALAAYTLWLLAFPMKGVLLGEQAGRTLLFTFLAPHIVTLLGLGSISKLGLLERWCDAGVGLTMAVTLGFPLLGQEHSMIAMALAGIASALVMIKVGTVLRSSPSSTISAALGLILGNALVFILSQLALSPLILAALLAVLLAVVLQPGARPEPVRTRNLLQYLPFICVYSIVNGLRYDLLQSPIALPTLPEGTELFGYILAVLAAFALFRRDKDLTLVLGILFGMLSLSFGLQSSEAAMFLSMITMQASAGFVDLFLLGLLLIQDNTIRAFGWGIGAMCSGIAVGEIAAGQLHDAGIAISIAGNGALTLAILLLYLLGRQNGFAPGNERLKGSEYAGPASGKDYGSGDILQGLPSHARARLSSRERSILELVVAGWNYKGVAEEIGISESSVKTYMRRAFDKLGVSGKRELLVKYFSEGELIEGSSS